MLELPYKATTRALEETNLFVIHKRSFERLLHVHPRLAEVFTQKLTKEKEIYMELRQQLEELGLLNMTDQHHHFTSWVLGRLNPLFPARSQAL